MARRNFRAFGKRQWSSGIKETGHDLSLYRRSYSLICTGPFADFGTKTSRFIRRGEIMKTAEVLHAWARILAGRAPSLSIEITKECPLRCPGCYAFDAAHLGDKTQLRQLSDFKGQELVTRVLALIDEHKPLHVSLVGGDPLVRSRELGLLLPQIESRGVHTQVVTSAFRVIPNVWMELKKLALWQNSWVEEGTTDEASGRKITKAIVGPAARGNAASASGFPASRLPRGMNLAIRHKNS
jgi:hypothetical protein